MTATSIDYEAEYNNRKRVPEHVEILDRWQTLSSAYRLASAPQTDVPYGPRERQRYDLFSPADTSPLAAYIHGGYWQRGDRKDFSFIARELNAQGIAVAIPSYSLCPAASITEIIDDVSLCLAALWKKTRKRPLVIGHSAGGHLTAAMVANDWSRVAGVPADLVRGGYALSGVYDLPPLIGTSINEALRLSNGTARAASPLFRPAPPKGRHFVAAVGGEESAEFLRQSRDIADTWQKAGVYAECVVIPGANHFTIVEELIRPDSPMLARIVALARELDAP
ncbi:MAG: alpha/beta hydrolase [Hyphomicrobiaceae bacterium]|nr:MAG: alpha/beta hydrolase [Hyphomicrobiaceae bacterium]